jgi:tryptophan synthase alpha chain
VSVDAGAERDVSTVPANAGAERIAGAFAGSGKRAALLPYLMGGFPDLAGSRAIGDAYADGGADLMELGVPFSDPMADGPVIQAAGTRALAAGATVDGVLEVCAALAARVPVVVMCYANLVFARGVERMAQRLRDAGASGLIVPDLPHEEAGETREACDAAGVALVPLVAPTTPDDRLEAVGAEARGFLYAVSVTGTTGEREAIADAFGPIVSRAKSRAAVPVAIGFGIATPGDASRAADTGADGVIVGSRLVRAAAEADDPPAAVREVVSGLAEALR